MHLGVYAIVVRTGNMVCAINMIVLAIQVDTCLVAGIAYLSSYGQMSHWQYIQGACML